MLMAATGLDEDPRVRAWIRTRFQAELAAPTGPSRVIACAPLEFLRLSVGSTGPAFVYLHPSGAVLVDGRDCGGNWEGDPSDVLRAYRAHEPDARTLMFTRRDAPPVDATGLKATVLVFPEAL